MNVEFSLKNNSIVLDADGCPVVRAAARIAREFSVHCTIVCDFAHTFNIEDTETVIVSQGADSADFYIVNHIKSGDIVVTQDYGLAAMCLAKNVIVLNQDGKIYNDGNIGSLLECRAAGKKIRRAGGRTKGPRKRTQEQDQKFEKALRRILENGSV